MSPGLCFPFINEYLVFQIFFVAVLSPTSDPDQNLINESRLNPMNDFSSKTSDFGFPSEDLHSGVTLTTSINIY